MVTIRIAESRKCNGDYSMFVSFNYNQRIVDMIRVLPSRYWDKDAKEWEIPIKQYPTLKADLDRLDKVQLVGKTEVLSAVPKPVDLSKIDFKFKTNPFEHQIEGFKFGLTHDRWLLGDEQGLGKTKQVIDISHLLIGLELADDTTLDELISCLVTSNIGCCINTLNCLCSKS